MFETGLHCLQCAISYYLGLRDNKYVSQLGRRLTLLNRFQRSSYSPACQAKIEMMAYLHLPGCFIESQGL